MESSARDFLARFESAGAAWLADGRTPDGPPAARGSLERICREGLGEYRRQRDITAVGRPLAPEALDRIAGALDAETNDAISELERGHLVLAIAASASPFIGLFGTVWGIMNAFRGMSLEGSAGIAAVAPGVAEALVTTVAGLAVAIPAVISYNVLNRRVQLLAALFDRFANRFLTVADRAARDVAAPAVPGLEQEASPEFARRPV
jgi:biopolymer transport protein TolQ